MELVSCQPPDNFLSQGCRGQIWEHNNEGADIRVSPLYINMERGYAECARIGSTAEEIFILLTSVYESVQNKAENDR